MQKLYPVVQDKNANKAQTNGQIRKMTNGEVPKMN